ncbi:MAG: amidase [Sphingomonadaceae bacterium]|nr:amidase [Sphingomonadaceae bacterium]
MAEYAWGKGAAQTAAAIAAGQTSARAECEAAIARIEALNGPINAVIVKDYERARADADAADAAIARGERRPLLGVPMTVKESFELAGHPQTWGFDHARGNIPVEDGSTVRRLRAAGAVILGKTNVPVALADLQSVNPNYGRTNNPWDMARVPGGSSGGSAAALASGMVPLEMGSDIGGSIRTPAHFCGIFGHKTSYGVIPLDGHRYPGTDGADRPMSVAGPMARHAEDLSLALDVVAARPLPRARITTLSGARLLLLTEHPRAAVSREIVAALEDAAERAAAAGAVVLHEHAELSNLSDLFDAYMKMLTITVSGGAPAPNGYVATVADWFALQDVQARIQRQFAKLFGDVDAILAPVFGTTAFVHDDRAMMDRTLDVDGVPTRFADQFAWISMATFCHLPSTSTPIAIGAGDLPINMQVITPFMADHDAISLAGMLAQPRAC